MAGALGTEGRIKDRKCGKDGRLTDQGGGRKEEEGGMRTPWESDPVTGLGGGDSKVSTDVMSVRGLQVIQGAWE